MHSLEALGDDRRGVVATSLRTPSASGPFPAVRARVSPRAPWSAGTFDPVSRSCARPGCGNDAVATLSYAYAEGLVVLEDLSPEAHPMVHDLCRQHAEGLRVPLGWDLRDERAATVDLREAAGSGTQLDLIGA